MEGKAVLFKKFADIDSIDIEIDENNVETLVDTIARLGTSHLGALTSRISRHPNVSKSNAVARTDENSCIP
jgi:malic enzyme